MSDFDKEAEREKLREKYEAEEEKRQATEQMSELLLKGATMTNAHCSDCGDPVFRYDGQEFCPTCQKPITREPADDGADDDGHIEVANPGEEARVQFGAQEEGDEADAASGSAADETQAAESRTSEAPDQSQAVSPETGQRTPDRGQPGPRETVGGEAAQSSTADQSTASADDETPTTPAGGPGADDPSVSSRTVDSSDDVAADVAAAEQLLARTLRQFSERAAGTDNPRRAREHLDAAREAAEALDAIGY